MADIKIEVITYEQSRLAYFKKLQSRQKKRFEQFEKSSVIKELPPQERHYQLSKMGEVLQYYDDVVKMLEDAPTADVVDVVRCSECKYAAEVEYMGCTCKNEKTPWCNDEFEVYMNPTDFCSYGERRTDDGNV